MFFNFFSVSNKIKEQPVIDIRIKNIKENVGIVLYNDIVATMKQPSNNIANTVYLTMMSFLFLFTSTLLRFYFNIIAQF